MLSAFRKSFRNLSWKHRQSKITKRFEYSFESPWERDVIIVGLVGTSTLINKSLFLDL
ncbi:unnamed protein product [Callosobruchus maculatus]|uniref:Uncharacterized protein n=1 Tax=Callosobruchus maculatus TaxID=64391 RepID=A0A653CGK1_CALMS|nr:unnamed protein product [Callosobruchus maculatus]